MQEIVAAAESWSVAASRIIPFAASATGVLAWLVVFSVRRVRKGRGEARSMRLSKAQAYARIQELGALLLDTEPDPRVAERYATARAAFDEARTARAMAEVGRIAEEGLELS